MPTRPAGRTLGADPGLTALLLALPGPGFSLRLLLAVVVTGTWTTALAMDLAGAAGPDLLERQLASTAAAPSQP